MARATEIELLYYRKAFYQLKQSGEYPEDMTYQDLSQKEKERVRRKGKALLLIARLV